MENQIRKVVKEYIKKLHEMGGIDMDKVFMKGKGISRKPNLSTAVISSANWHPDDSSGGVIDYMEWEDGTEMTPLEIQDWSESNPEIWDEIMYNDRVSEGMSDEEWADAKEAERLANHPEKDKINKIKQMMDKEEDDKEQEEYDKGWYGESLKEIAAELGYLNEDDLEKRLSNGINAITGGGSQHASISDEGDKIKIKFSYARGEFDPEEWAKIINYLEGMGFFILDDSNYYESSYDYEDPPEAVPTIYIKKVDTSAAGLVPGDPDWPGEDDRDNFPNPEDLK